MFPPHVNDRYGGLHSGRTGVDWLARSAHELFLCAHRWRRPVVRSSGTGWHLEVLLLVDLPQPLDLLLQRFLMSWRKVYIYSSVMFVNWSMMMNKSISPTFLSGRNIISSRRKELWTSGSTYHPWRSCPEQELRSAAWGGYCRRSVWSAVDPEMPRGETARTPRSAEPTNHQINDRFTSSSRASK